MEVQIHYSIQNQSHFCGRPMNHQSMEVQLVHRHLTEENHLDLLHNILTPKINNGKKGTAWTVFSFLILIYYKRRYKYAVPKKIVSRSDCKILLAVQIIKKQTIPIKLKC